MAIPQPFIIQCGTKPARYKMTQVNLVSVFKFVNYFANNTATAVCRHGCVEVDRAMRTIGASKNVGDRPFERLRACLAKWWHDADDLCFTVIAEILAGSDAFPANRACRRIQ